MGLKFGQLGSQVAVCYEAAKKGTDASKVVTWTNRVIHAVAVGMNLYSTLTGKPLIKYNSGQ